MSECFSFHLCQNIFSFAYINNFYIRGRPFQSIPPKLHLLQIRVNLYRVDLTRIIKLLELILCIKVPLITTDYLCQKIFFSYMSKYFLFAYINNFYIRGRPFQSIPPKLHLLQIRVNLYRVDLTRVIKLLE